MSDLSVIPSVEQLLQTGRAAELVAQYGRPLTLEALRSTLVSLREHFTPIDTLPDRQGILSSTSDLLERWAAPTLIPVINATGVVLHTNLGRAPLSLAALQAIQITAWGYSNLEFSLERGGRGTRLAHTENLLTHLTRAEAALVVNNNASAVLLALTALARHKRVIISRTQLVEIGGGFRLPDVMAQSGAKLVEIGTTNQVHLDDYVEALQTPAALVLRAHPSNFRIIGFTSQPALSEMAIAAHHAGALMMDDLGSGTLLDTARFGMAHEPTVQESIAAGCDIVCFSGDKLLGGPQAGIIVGKAELIALLKRHPLARAVRADKLCLAALSATLLHYLKDEAEREIPIWQMISKTPEQLKARAENWANALGAYRVLADVIPGESTVGGGSLPGETLPTYLLALKVPQPNQFVACLRRSNPPIITRVQDGLVMCDPRTILPDQEGAFLVGLQNCLPNILNAPPPAQPMN